MAYYGYEIEQNPGKGIPLKIRIYSILEGIEWRSKTAFVNLKNVIG